APAVETLESGRATAPPRRRGGNVEYVCQFRQRALVHSRDSSARGDARRPRPASLRATLRVTLARPPAPTSRPASRATRTLRAIPLLVHALRAATRRRAFCVREQRLRGTVYCPLAANGFAGPQVVSAAGWAGRAVGVTSSFQGEGQCAKCL